MICNLRHQLSTACLMMRQAAEQLAASVRISDLEKELQMARGASAKAGWCGYWANSRDEECCIIRLLSSLDFWPVS